MQRCYAHGTLVTHCFPQLLLHTIRNGKCCRHPFIMSVYLFDLMSSNRMKSPDVRYSRCSFLFLWLLSGSFGIVVAVFLLFAQDQIWKNASFWPVTLHTSKGIHIALEFVCHCCYCSSRYFILSSRKKTITTNNRIVTQSIIECS